MSFTDLGLSPETLQAIADVGYATPTPIQEQAIPIVLMGRDVLGIAQTGTGKTASFTLPMIDILAHGRAKARMPRSLIVAPTRELANQVAENFTLYGKYHSLSMALLIGGESFGEQEKVLDRGVDVLIATPGRLLDLFDRGRILLRDVRILVIDEADRMLDMGFIPDVERIVSLLPPLRQTLFFSATMDDSIRKLADSFLNNPREVRVARQSTTAATVTQNLVVVDELDKREALRHILNMEDVRNAFIFCNRKRDVGILHRSLKKHGFDVAQMHGDMAQSERTATLTQFKNNAVRLLVCSDVAARGIDIADVSHVFNFDVPIHSEDYVHRIGRTGRAGREGRAFTIASPEDAKFVQAIEKLIGTTLPRIELEGISSQELSEEAARDGRKKRREKERDKDRDKNERKARGRDERPRDSEKESPKENQREGASSMKSSETTRSDDRRSDDRRGEDRRSSRFGKDWGRDKDRNRDGKDREHRSWGRRVHPAWEVEEMEHDDDVLAFGDHVPAFMMQEIVLLNLRDDDGEDDALEPLKSPIEEIDAPLEMEKLVHAVHDGGEPIVAEGVAPPTEGSEESNGEHRRSRRRVSGRRRRVSGERSDFTPVAAAGATAGATAGEGGATDGDGEREAENTPGIGGDEKNTALPVAEAPAQAQAASEEATAQALRQSLDQTVPLAQAVEALVGLLDGGAESAVSLMPTEEAPAASPEVASLEATPSEIVVIETVRETEAEALGKETSEPASESESPAPRRRAARRRTQVAADDAQAAESAEASSRDEAEKVSKPRRAPRRKKADAETPEAAVSDADTSESKPAEAHGEEAPAKAPRRRSRRTAAEVAAENSGEGEAVRRPRRRRTAAASAATEDEAASSPAPTDRAEGSGEGE